MAASEGGESEGGESEGGESEGGESEGGESEGGESATSMNAGLYGWASGTSQATPHVTGIVALMRSVNPLLTPASVLGDLAGNHGSLSMLPGKRRALASSMRRVP